jgi:predicted dehydrogenase
VSALRVGIVGSGFMGLTHAEAVRQFEGAELAGVAGGRRAESLANRYGAPLEASAEALIDRDDVDAVVLATPHHLHAEHALRAFARGKHVLVEKPMATMLADCDAMIEAAARAGRALAVGFQQRFRVNNREARRLVREGALGTIHLVHVSMLPSVAPMLEDGGFGGKWEWWLDPRSVGHILNSGPHAIDLLRWTMGAEMRSVAALCRSTRPGVSVEDTTAALIEWDNGAVCTLDSSCVAPPPSFPGEEFRFRFLGSGAVMDLDSFTTLRVSSGGELRPASEQPATGHQSAGAFLGPGRMQAYADQLRSFVSACAGGPSEAGTGEDGRASVAGCLAMLEASVSGSVLRLA